MVRQISRPPLTIDEKRSFWTTTVVELSVLYHARNIVYDVLLYIGNVLIFKQKSNVKLISKDVNKENYIIRRVETNDLLDN